MLQRPNFSAQFTARNLSQVQKSESTNHLSIAFHHKEIQVYRIIEFHSLIKIRISNTHRMFGTHFISFKMLAKDRTFVVDALQTLCATLYSSCSFCSKDFTFNSLFFLKCIYNRGFVFFSLKVYSCCG